MSDFNELWVNNSSDTKGTICLVNGHGHTNRHHKNRNGWYLGLVTDSIYYS